MESIARRGVRVHDVRAPAPALLLALATGLPLGGSACAPARSNSTAEGATESASATDPTDGSSSAPASDSEGSGTSSATSGGTAATSVTTGSTTSTSGGTNPTGAELTGMDLYAGDCLPCHGFDALGGEFGPELRHPVRPYALWILRNGRPGPDYPLAEMFPYPEDDITDEDAQKIWDYLDSFERPTTPEGLYLDFCGYCHGEDGSGGTVGVDLRATTLERNLEVVRTGFGGTDYGSRETYMPSWSGQDLTDPEIESMVAWWSGADSG